MKDINRPNIRRDFYSYAINFASLAAGAANSAAIQIQADSQFEVQKFSFFADIAGAAQTESTRVLPLMTIQVTDTGTGRQMFNTPVPIPALMGDGRIPFILPTTKVFSPSSAVQIDVANYSAATAYLLRVVFIGAKIFEYGA